MTIAEKLRLASISLFGLSIGDAFGETFFGNEDLITKRLINRELKSSSWNFTDDTVMAIGIYNMLAQGGKVDQAKLAAEFARNYNLDNYRGYGGTAHAILRAIGEGEDWKTVSSNAFDGMGSMGNGAAMRAAPLGAYFHDDVYTLVAQARLSAEVTHYNEEAIAGAIAVALAASIVIQQPGIAPADFFNFIIQHTPASDTRSKIQKAATLPANYDLRTIVSILGSGAKMLAQDTVPFALWCAAHHLHDFEAAIWTTVNGLGDRDTTCAIVGGIVALSAGTEHIPQEWINHTEDYKSTLFFNR
ncbi:ADP-ribosylglycohydrolase family protein [Chitinophaga sp.]|uniref:ADP-ribosylglycohydrolase family protein n=1 Tax=Chitinophaga sp. TaxID=1869181 RepID=UPI0031D9D208